MAHVGRRAAWGAALAAATVAAASATLPAAGLRAPAGSTARAAKPTKATQTRPKPTRAKATAAPAPAPNALKRWAATNGGGPTAQSPTLAQAQQAAANYDLILATKKSYPPYVAAMRQTNPELRIVAYLNGAYAQSDEGTAFPEAWYARDASGAKVRSKKFGNYLMDPTHPGWIQNRSQLCADYATQAGYDGCYLDMLGTATMGNGYVSAPPINPATHTEWTKQTWMPATSQLAAAVQSANPTRLVVANGLGNGNQYFDPASGPTSVLLNGIPGANAQGWIRSESDALTDFRPVKAWKHDVDMLADAANRGRFVMAMTKVGRAATAAQMQQVHRYALASFLLGTDGTQYFFFSPNGNDDGVDAPDTPDDHVNPGMPTARYSTLPNGAYGRPFSNGYAAVNPTTATVTVNLGAAYVDLDGRPVSQATLGPHTGMVFTKSQATTTTAAVTTTVPPPTTTTACVPRPRRQPTPQALTAATTSTTTRNVIVRATTTTTARTGAALTSAQKATATTTTAPAAADTSELRRSSPRRCRPRPAP